VRRLLQLELREVAGLDERHLGTLEGDDLIRVWIDVPTDLLAIVEVRRVGGAFAQRALAIGGYPSDVAAEVVTLAASEMVRVLARAHKTPEPVPQPSQPHAPSGGGAFAVGGAISGLILPGSTPGIVLGPELAVELRHGMFGHRLYGRWQLGVSEQRARWFEIGAGIDYRIELAPTWRLHLGVKAGFVDVSLPEAARIEGEVTTRDWTVRTAGEIGIEGRIAPGSWLALSVAPGATLRPLDIELNDGTTSELGGFAFGINLGLNASPFE
jgi:hypothetical protein